MVPAHLTGPMGTDVVAPRRAAWKQKERGGRFFLSYFSFGHHLVSATEVLGSNASIASWKKRAVRGWLSDVSKPFG